MAPRRADRASGQIPPRTLPGVGGDPDPPQHPLAPLPVSHPNSSFSLNFPLPTFRSWLPQFPSLFCWLTPPLFLLCPPHEEGFQVAEAPLGVCAPH